MKDFAALIQAVATLLWPLLTFWVIYHFRGEIKELARRLQKGKFLGQEIELRSEVVQLQAEATAAISAVAEQPQRGHRVTADPAADAEISRIIANSALSPRSALILVASAIEREVREILASQGRYSRQVSLPVAFSDLQGLGVVPDVLVSSVRRFWTVRNKLVHGYDSHDAEIISALDSGITILRAIKDVPRPIYTVRSTNLPVFSDENCSRVIEGVQALELQMDAGDESGQLTVPVTRSTDTVGKRVAWEWDAHRRFGRAWYRKPDSTAVQVAWEDNAMEFVGRQLEEETQPLS